MAFPGIANVGSILGVLSKMESPKEEDRLAALREADQLIHDGSLISIIFSAARVEWSGDCRLVVVSRETCDIVVLSLAHLQRQITKPFKSTTRKTFVLKPTG